MHFDYYEKNNKELKLQIQPNLYLDYLLMQAYDNISISLSETVYCFED